MQNYLVAGDVIPYVVPADTTIVSGQAVTIGSMVGSAVGGGTTGNEIMIRVSGVVILTKKTTDVIAQGVPVYHDADAGEITTTATDNTLAGYAYESAGNGDTTVKVKLLF